MQMTPVSKSPCNDDAASPHVLLVPLPGQGHLNPFISLANYLSACGVSVTLVRSARAHAQLSQAQNSSPSLPASPTTPHESQSEGSPMAMPQPVRIEVVPDGLPTDPKQRCHPVKFLESIAVIGKGVEELLARLMEEEQAPCCLIVDNLISWGNDVASKFGLPWMMLWTGCASGFSVGIHIPELAAKGYLPAIDDGSKDKLVDFIPGLSPFHIRDLPKAINVEEDPRISPAFQFFWSILDSVRHAERLLVNSFYELESSVVEALCKEAGFHIDLVGPLFLMGSLFSASNVPTAAASLLQEDNSCLSWLDQQQETSVLYISFGSFVSVEGDAIEELAHGLEASGLNYLWVIRPDALSDKASVEELLPEGFMERTHDRGRIISWAPQLAVLRHPSVGAFLTHCGWNSILESMCSGVPMLGFPQQAEQNTNLKFIVHDWKVGFPLLPPKARQVERSDVQRAVTKLLRSDEGADIRKHALHWKEVALKACSGSSKANLEKLVDDLKSRRLKAPVQLHS